MGWISEGGSGDGDRESVTCLVPSRGSWSFPSHQVSQAGDKFLVGGDFWAFLQSRWECVVVDFELQRFRALACVKQDVTAAYPFSHSRSVAGRGWVGLQFTICKVN